MTKSTGRKIMHHYVHQKYLEAWKLPKTIYVYDLQQKKSFEKTGPDIGAERGYNRFSFDEKVIELLRYAFSRRATHGSAYDLMLSFIEFMKNFDYQHKEDNLIEDFYGHFESRIGHALKKIANREPLIQGGNVKEFDSLVFFFCLQLFRTPKARGLLSHEMVSMYHAGHELRPTQKAEFIKIYLLISALAMATDILNSGCQIRLHYVRDGSKIINCDAPVVLKTRAMEQLNDLNGWMPLNPHVLMEISQVCQGGKEELRRYISGDDVMRLNWKIITNAERLVYFSSEDQRAAYLEKMASPRKF